MKLTLQDALIIINRGYDDKTEALHKLAQDLLSQKYEEILLKMERENLQEKERRFRNKQKGL